MAEAAFLSEGFFDDGAVGVSVCIFANFSAVVFLLTFLDFFCIKTIEFFDPGTEPFMKIRLFSGSNLIISRF